MVPRKTRNNETVRASSRGTCWAHRETVFSALAQRSDRPTTRPAGQILLYSNQHESIVNKLIFAITSRPFIPDVDVGGGVFHRRSICGAPRHLGPGACGRSATQARNSTTDRAARLCRHCKNENLGKTGESGRKEN